MKHLKIKSSHLKKFRFMYFAMAFGFIGAVILYFAIAATRSRVIEPEEGTTNTQVSLVSDGTAAGGKYVQFNTSAPSQGDAPVPLPAQFVGGYFEGWTGMYPSQIPASYNVLYHAFGAVESNGSVSIIVPPDRQRLANEYKARKAQGKPTILSLGGQDGANVGMTNSTQIQNLVNSLIPIIDEFGFSGIDWDLEEVPGGISAAGVANASRQLKSHYGSTFIIAVAPYDGTEDTYMEIARQLGTDLTSVGYQFYNTGIQVSVASVNARIQDWINSTGISASQFSVGFWYGPDNHQYATAETQMANIYRGVKSTYPTVRGAWTWGITETDEPRGYAFANNMPGAVY